MFADNAKINFSKITRIHTHTQPHMEISYRKRFDTLDAIANHVHRFRIEHRTGNSFAEKNSNTNQSQI